MLSKAEKDYIIELLDKGENIPEDFKNKLFPIGHKEYELAYAGKMRKEDLFANEDGSFPVPLQVEKVFNGTEHPSFDDGWRNMIIFGDNLQFLKTIYKNEDPIIKDKVKGKVKLIYIDPPFATSDDFQSPDGAKAYQDKKKGAEFVEFLRRRLLIAREILADDGSIYVHLDQKMVYHLRIIMDEVFGKNCFRNTIIWHYGGRMMHNVSQYNRKHDVILFYTKNPTNYYFNLPSEEVNFEKYAKSRHEKIHIDEKGNRYLLAPDATMERTIRQYEDEIVQRGRAIDDVWEIRYIRGNAKERTGYPTQKPEELLKRIITASSQEGDIVLDFFAGSGVTAAVAEKLNRKWIICDIGKLSYFISQSRMLKINISNSLVHDNTPYKMPAKSFATCTQIYDLNTTLNMKFDKYKKFVSGLFDIDVKQFKLGGYTFDGKKDGDPVVIFDYNQFPDANIDELFVENISKYIGNKLKGSRVYIVSPSTRVDFITDYEEIDDIRYYFLKIPYQIIKELHQKDFKKFRQPRSKNNVNSLDESIGFSFNRTPVVKSELIVTDRKVKIKIDSFSSEEPRSAKTATEKQLSGFDLLSAVFIDSNHNGKEFIMTDSFFCDDMKQEGNELIIGLNKSSVGEKLMVVYTDIFGNDFTESFTIQEEKIWKK